MPEFDYGAMVELADDLIGTQFGRDDATLRHFTNGGSETNPTRTHDDLPIKCVDLNVKKRDKDGTLVGSSSRTLLVAASSELTIAKDDIVYIGDVVPANAHEVESYDILQPGGVVLLYEITLKA